MSVGFIWGRMPSDRTKKVFDLAFEEAKSSSQKPIYILVPEKYTYEMEKKLSQRLLIDKDPNFRIRVASFSTLSNIVFTNVSGLRDRKISKSARDRKSTRLNSSHANISYAVFCLKKKK